MEIGVDGLAERFTRLDLVVEFVVVFFEAGMRAESDRRRATGLVQPGCERRVVGMAMSDEDRPNPIAREGIDQRLAVLVEYGTRVDHGDVAMADDVGAGSLICVLGRVVRNHPAYQRRHGHRFATAGIVEGDERYRTHRVTLRRDRAHL